MYKMRRKSKMKQEITQSKKEKKIWTKHWNLSTGTCWLMRQTKQRPLFDRNRWHTDALWFVFRSAKIILEMIAFGCCWWAAVRLFGRATDTCTSVWLIECKQFPFIFGFGKNFGIFTKSIYLRMRGGRFFFSRPLCRSLTLTLDWVTWLTHAARILSACTIDSTANEREREREGASVRWYISIMAHDVIGTDFAEEPHKTPERLSHSLNRMQRDLFVR